MRQRFTITFIASCIILCAAGIIEFTSCSKDAATQSSAKAAVAENAIRNENLIAWYTFNGDTKDHSGNHNDVNFNNATSAAGRYGAPNTAYLFNGTSSYMSVPNSTSLNPANGITIIAVVQPLGFYQGQCHSNRIICKGYDDNDNGRYNMGYDDQPYWNYEGCDATVKEKRESFYGSYGDGHGTAAGLTDLATYVKQSKWYVLAFTFDGRRSIFYVNGVAQAANLRTTTYTPNSNPLFIGRNQDPKFPYYFNGIIDEIRIYNTALTQNKIEQLAP